MIELLVGIVIIGVVAWVVTTYIPMPPPIKGIIIGVAILFCLLLILRAFGGVDMSLPRLR